MRTRLLGSYIVYNSGLSLCGIEYSGVESGVESGEGIVECM